MNAFFNIAVFAFSATMLTMYFVAPMFMSYRMIKSVKGSGIHLLISLVPGANVYYASYLYDGDAFSIFAISYVTCVIGLLLRIPAIALSSIPIATVSVWLTIVGFLVYAVSGYFYTKELLGSYAYVFSTLSFVFFPIAALNFFALGEEYAKNVAKDSTATSKGMKEKFRL